MEIKHFFKHLAGLSLALCLVAALPPARAAFENTPASSSAAPEAGDAAWDGIMQTEEPAVSDVEAADEPAEEPPVDPATGFSDTPAERYDYQSIRWAVERGVIREDSTRFRPDEPITRAQILTMLWRAMGEPQATARNPFLDVDEDGEARDAVLWAVGFGVAAGVGDDRFEPDRPCTRAELLTFLGRAAGCWPMTGDALTFGYVQPSD